MKEIRFIDVASGEMINQIVPEDTEVTAEFIQQLFSKDNE